MASYRAFNPTKSDKLVGIAVTDGRIDALGAAVGRGMGAVVGTTERVGAGVVASAMGWIFFMALVGGEIRPKRRPKLRRE